MTTDDPPEPDGHPGLRRLTDRFTRHQLRARAGREETEPAEAVRTAAFDLGADIAHPAPGHAEAAHDVGTDIGVDPRRPAPTRTADKELP
ncbi:hypothetical protein OHB00_37665 [Streptomyces sp. NBC_00631]|uniref:hypothetical protein n=1 Tax=Streptomyces sp. NBC_00631 TaxID=2975793 RepID=UPI0030DF7358